MYLLAAFILEFFDRRTLEELVRDLRTKRKANKPANPNANPPG